MQVVFRSLLATAVVVWAASCSLNDHGLGGGGDAGHSTGAAGHATGVAGATGAAGAAGAAGTGGGAGTTGGAGGAAGGAAGTTATPPQIGCSDGTREGYLDKNKYPTIAACAGAWDDPGLSSPNSRTPQCDRRAGNDGDKSDGRGCSVADLCASGWHVCETAHAVSLATNGAGCPDAMTTTGDKMVFYVTRQRATNLSCDTSGSNNLYGCGNIGSTADKTSCAPFTRMLRDTDCQATFTWVCSDGPPGTATDEYDVVTKLTSSRGGVLCCQN